MSQSTALANFAWSLKPIIILMAIFGHPMSSLSQNLNRNHLKVFIITFGLTILITDIAINCMSFSNILSTNIIGLRAGLQGPTNFLNVVVGHLFHVHFLIGIPLFFTATSILTRRWKDVILSLETIQSEMNLPEQVHIKLRSYSYFAIIMFILDEAAWMYQIMDSSYWKGIPNISQKCAVVLGNLSHVAASCIQTTLFVFISASMLLFENLKTQMEMISIHWSKKNLQSSQNDRSLFSLQLEKWRRCYDIVCLLVERINQCFGPCILITLSYTFGIFVKYSCQALTQFQSGDKEKRLLAYLLTLTIVSFRIINILYASHHMHLAGKIVSKKILSIPSSGHIQTQAQVETIILQVSYFRPTINAMGFTDFEFFLIPTLIGVTLTYSIVLYEAYHGLQIIILPRF